MIELPAGLSLDIDQFRVFNEIGRIVDRLYRSEDLYEVVIKEIVTFSRRLFAARGERVARQCILFSVLLGSSIPPDADFAAYIFDFEGEDSIATFVRGLDRQQWEG